MRALALAFALLAAAPAAGERRMLEAAEAEAFRAVGRLNIAGARFCTATLIAERRVLTAAHCLFQPRTGRAVPMSELRFVPGHRLQANAGVHRVTRAAVAPGFVLKAEPRPGDLGADIALLELDGPAAVPPIEVGPLAEGTAFAIVSYGRRRAQAPSMDEACPLRGVMGALLLVGCAVEGGVSGAPVLAGGRVVAVVSSMGRLPWGEEFALTVLAGPWVERLEARLTSE